MAKQSNLDIRNYVFYQVFPRQYADTHDFKGVIKDLKRIKDLGVDVLYLLPIHPIGKKARKGSEGSSYSIYDYYQINPAYGDMSDFDQLVSKAHELGLKVMIDIVINHTSRDSILTKEHKDWFYHDEQGNFANRVGDWSDITDLDYRLKEVWAYMQDMLIFWSRKVDGFRCDVAPLIPIDFWIETRTKINQLKPDFIWLTESVHPGFIKYLRDMGFECHSDAEMYQAFDICYDYDIADEMNAYFKDHNELSTWMDAIKKQEVIYPKNYMKLRNFENHDQPRLRSLVKNESHFIQMLALMFFLKGPTMLYAGMEYQEDHMPSLFEIDMLKWDKTLSLEPLVKTLSNIKKDVLFRNGIFNIIKQDDIVVIKYELNDEVLLGIFNLGNLNETDIPLVDGTYINKINEASIDIKNGMIKLDNHPIIIKTSKECSR